MAAAKELTVSETLAPFLSFLSPFLVSALVSEVVPLRSLCTTDKRKQQKNHQEYEHRYTNLEQSFFGLEPKITSLKSPRAYINIWTDVFI